jgi:hypothetical protein
MSEEELEAELRRQVLEAAMSMKKVEVIDGQSVPNLPLVGGAAEVGLAALPSHAPGGELPDRGTE